MKANGGSFYLPKMRVLNHKCELIKKNGLSKQKDDCDSDVLGFR